MNDNQGFGPDADEDLPESVLADIEDGVPVLKALRRWKGLTIDALATASGVSSASIYGAEAGRQPSFVARQALARVLGVGTQLLSEQRSQR